MVVLCHSHPTIYKIKRRNPTGSSVTSAKYTTKYWDITSNSNNSITKETTNTAALTGALIVIVNSKDGYARKKEKNKLKINSIGQDTNS